jgi:hypothetical protein
MYGLKPVSSKIIDFFRASKAVFENMFYKLFAAGEVVSCCKVIALPGWLIWKQNPAPWFWRGTGSKNTFVRE